MEITISNLEEILNEYKKIPQVKAIAVGGSSLNCTDDENSDIDIYIFVSEDIPVDIRENIVKPISSKYEVGGQYFGDGDEFFVNSLDKQLDVMYWNTQWFENIIENVWIKHCPSNGYTTCFIHTLKICRIIYDTDNWLLNLKNKINTDYPVNLQQNIIKRNLMLLKNKPFASYYAQIEKAIKRNDIVSINHRVSAFLASYFDIIFALNKLLHPGEKRLISYAEKNCTLLPANFEENINKLLCQSQSDILLTLDEILLALEIIL